MNKKVIIQCDFDGTLTNEDISFKILDRYATIDWRAEMKEYMSRQISIGQFNQNVFKSVKEDRDTLITLIKENEDVRAGITEFFDFCKNEGFDLRIVSNGLHLYIDQILEDLDYSDIPVYAAASEFTDDGMNSTYHDPYGNETMNDYKLGYAQYFKERADEVIYIGNGSSDYAPAKVCDYVFATDTLSRKCAEGGVPYTYFDTLFTVIDGLKKRYNIK